MPRLRRFTGCVVFTLITIPAGHPARAQRLSDADRREVRELVAAADAAMRGEFTPRADWLELQWHCLRAPGGETYVPFTLLVHGEAAEALSSVAMYVRVARRGERTTAADYERRSLGPPAQDDLPVFSYDAAAAASAKLRVLSEAPKRKSPFLFQAVHFTVSRGESAARPSFGARLRFAPAATTFTSS